MLFLVQGKVAKKYYMNDTPNVSLVVRLVEAESEEEARDKFLKHFYDKTEEYSVYYDPSIHDISEVIK